MKLQTRLPISQIRKVQHALTLLLVFFIYYALAHTVLYTPPRVISEGDQAPILFSTETKSPLKQSLLHALDSAEKSITMMIYNLCDKQVIMQLKKAADRGVKVTVLADPYSSPDIGSDLPYPITTAFIKPSRGLMHLKIIVIDSKEIWFGSANMSTTSLESHGNLCAALYCPSFAAYLEEIANEMLHKERVLQKPFVLHVKNQTFRFFLSPVHGKESLAYLIQKIDQASKRIFVAMYTFTNKELLEGLLRAKKRGVDVRVVFDNDSSKNTSKLAYMRLQHMNIPVGIRTTPGLLHHKFALIDDELEMGSCNWTRSGFLTNYDCIMWFEPMNEKERDHVDLLWKEIEKNSTLLATSHTKSD